MLSAFNAKLNFSNPKNLILISLSVAVPILAQAAGKGHAAHEHGVASLDVVAEGSAVTLLLKTPSESIYGFEHEAKNPNDIKLRDAAIEKLKVSAEKIFLFEPSTRCKLANHEIKPFVIEAKEENKKTGKKQIQKAGNHSEVHASFKFECSKPVSGSELSFAFQSYFKSVRTLKVQILSGEKQSGVTIKNDKGKVVL